MTELTSIQLRAGRILSARNMITEFGLESIRTQIRPAILTPDKSPRREAAGTHAEDVGLQGALTTQHPTPSIAADETIEMPESVDRGTDRVPTALQWVGADDQLIIEPAHPSRSDGFPTPAAPRPQLPSLASMPAPVSDDTSDVERVPAAKQWVRAQGPGGTGSHARRRREYPPPRPTAVQRQAPGGASAILPRGSGLQPESISPQPAMIRTQPHPSRSDAYSTPPTSGNLPARQPRNTEDSPTVPALARSTSAERAPASGALSPTPSSPDNQPTLPMADTAVQGAAGRMSAKRRHELAQIESAVQHRRQRQLHIDSGR